jgi:hypothetical protein
VEPAHLLELIRSAPERYGTVRATLRYRGTVSYAKDPREHSVQRGRTARVRGVCGGKPPGLSETRNRTALSSGAAGRGTRTATGGAWRRRCRVAGGNSRLRGSQETADRRTARQRAGVGAPRRSRPARTRSAVFRVGPRPLLDLLSPVHGRDLRDLWGVASFGSYGGGPVVVGGWGGGAPAWCARNGVGLGMEPWPLELGRELRRLGGRSDSRRRPVRPGRFNPRQPLPWR